MAALGVSDPYSNAKQFAFFVHASAGGSVAKIDFMFNYYLKFTDMGVGRGVKFGQTGSKRIRKPWSASFLWEIRRLTQFLARNKANEGAQMITDVISDTNNTDNG